MSDAEQNREKQQRCAAGATDVRGAPPRWFGASGRRDDQRYLFTYGGELIEVKRNQEWQQPSEDRKFYPRTPVLVQ